MNIYGYIYNFVHKKLWIKTKKINYDCKEDVFVA